MKKTSAHVKGMLLVYFVSALFLALLPSPSVVAQSTALVSVINPSTNDSNFKFYTNTTSVLAKFNATVQVSNVTNLYGYQVKLKYNSTLLNVTKAWLPTWDSTWVFYGRTNTFPLGPVYNRTIGFVMFGSTLLGVQPTFNGTGLLGKIEFQIKQAPPRLGKFSGILNITNEDTKLRDNTAAAIPFNTTNGAYEFSWAKATSSISINLSSQAVTLGGNVTINGAITPTRPNVNVTISQRRDTGGAWSTLAVVQTNKTSGYNYTWNTAGKALGTYQINASWAGDADTNGAVSETKSVTVGKVSSSISLNLSVSSVTVGENVVISGAITPVRVNVDVTISSRVTGGTWANLTTVKTTSNGDFSYTWKTDQTGEFEIKASWPGDDVTLSAGSSVNQLSVAAPPTNILLYAIVAAVVIIIIIAIVLYYLKAKRPKAKA